MSRRNRGQNQRRRESGPIEAWQVDEAERRARQGAAVSSFWILRMVDEIRASRRPTPIDYDGPRVRQKDVCLAAFRLGPVEVDDAELFHAWCDKVGMVDFTSERDGGIAFENRDGGVVAVGAGEWIIKLGENNFVSLDHESFTALYEVLP